MKIAVVVQRYGEKVIGGSESYARLISERLAKYHTFEVLTTCAESHNNWKPVYPPGTENINGVTVRRFKNYRGRRILSNLLAKFIVMFRESKYAGLIPQLLLFILMGPRTPSLLKYINRNRNDYDAFIFITYLFYPTVFGLMHAPEKAIFIPTAHDEHPLYMGIYKYLFHLPKAIVYLSEEEKTLVNTVTNNSEIKSDVIGIGMDPLIHNGSNFRNKYNIRCEYVFYSGRINKWKNCHRLFEYFINYQAKRKNDLKLILTGDTSMRIPRHRDILYMGKLPHNEVLEADQAAYATIHPSAYESFCMSAVESMSQGTPIIANAECAVLKGHCERSKAGLIYNGYHEFENCLDSLLQDRKLRNCLGNNGIRYAIDNYSWENIEKRFNTFLCKIFPGK